jgi:tRNA threonylcarbamoyladenosine biosynthesis protein TsaB
MHFVRRLEEQLPYTRAMLVLAVDTSGTMGSLAVAKDADILGVVSTSSAEAYSARMFRQLEFLLAELKVGLPAFDLFAVTAGPGSFTGLRVGLAAVKGWAEIYGRPIAAVSALEAVAVEALTKEEMVAAVLDGRRGQVFGALYAAEARGLREIVPACVLDAGEFLSVVEGQAGTGKLTIATTRPELIEAALAKSKLAAAAVVRVSPVLAPSVAQIGIECAARGELTNALELDANYIRRSDAEVLWKAQ